MRAALALLLAPYALSAYAISGTVRERSEDKLKPLAKALVVARTPNGKDVLGATRSDSEGRYTLPGPFKGQVRVSAGRGGYFVHSAGGMADPYVAVNCDAAQCGAFDFELAKAAVIRGKVVDDLGELVVSAQVQATMPEEQPPPSVASVKRVPTIEASIESSASGRVFTSCGRTRQIEVSRIGLT